jgi:integrase
MARMGEINRLTWEDVDLDRKTVVLYTRKKKGGHLTPRKVPMTTKLYTMLLRRHKNRDKDKPWVFGSGIGAGRKANSWKAPSRIERRSWAPSAGRWG